MENWAPSVYGSLMKTLIQSEPIRIVVFWSHDQHALKWNMFIIVPKFCFLFQCLRCEYKVTLDIIKKYSHLGGSDGVVLTSCRNDLLWNFWRSIHYATNRKSVNQVTKKSSIFMVFSFCHSSLLAPQRGTPVFCQASLQGIKRTTLMLRILSLSRKGSIL